MKKPEETQVNNRLIVALDTHNLTEFQDLLSDLSPHVHFFKIGLEVAMSIGITKAAELIRSTKAQVFIDCKLNDIPNTVEQAVRALAATGAEFLTVHVAAGRESILAANRAKGVSKILLVGALTSLSDEECLKSFGRNAEDQLKYTADLAIETKSDGIICSPAELAFLKKQTHYQNLILVTPGIRPAWSPKDDQKRSATPREAIKAGADYIVIGRPITSVKKTERVSVLKKVLEELAIPVY